MQNSIDVIVWWQTFSVGVLACDFSLLKTYMYFMTNRRQGGECLTDTHKAYKGQKKRLMNTKTQFRFWRLLVAFLVGIMCLNVCNYEFDPYGIGLPVDIAVPTSVEHW